MESGKVVSAWREVWEAVQEGHGLKPITPPAVVFVMSVVWRERSVGFAGLMQVPSIIPESIISSECRAWQLAVSSAQTGVIIDNKFCHL